ncbi:MAG: phage holin family protein [Solirubrobacteraceae bacterium]|nr:phage holin family protein [Solirubrobacteraceae bacterium]
MSAENEPHVAQALQNISTSVSALVSEEIALAKAEVGGKVKNLGIGAGVGAAAGAFLFFAFILFTNAIAWGIWELVGGGIFLGFLLAGVLYVILAAIAGYVALRLLKKGAPPVPTQAIAEAKLTKEAVTEARRTA